MVGFCLNLLIAYGNIKVDQVPVQVSTRPRLVLRCANQNPGKQQMVRVRLCSTSLCVDYGYCQRILYWDKIQSRCS